MKVFIETENNYITLPTHSVVGGEAEVFIDYEWSYKIYHDKNKAISSEKFNDLKILENPSIVSPNSLIFDKKQGSIIGYRMRTIRDSFPLSRLITNEFRNQHNISNNDILKLIQKMKETIEFIHSQNCLIVDGNEMNFLVSKDFSQVYFIDVDSYQTPNFKANAYSISTIDPLSVKDKKFNTLSDWFSFAIIACTLILGIHPFKGTYKGLSLSIKKGDLEKRMQYRRSIFNDKVTYTSIVRDFNLIPNHYKDWFVSLFEDTIRTHPPKDIFDVSYKEYKNNFINKQYNQKVKATILYDHDKAIKKIYKFNDDIFIKDELGFINIKGQEYFSYTNKNTEILFTNNAYFLIKLEDTVKIYVCNEKKTIDTHIKAESFFVIDNRLYTIESNSLNEYSFINNKAIIINHWNIIPETLELFSGLLIQKVSYKNILYIPFEKESCAIINIKEIDNKKVLNARYANKIVDLVIFNGQNFERLIIKLDNNMKNYKIISNESTESLDINSTVLTNGIYITIPKDGYIYITSNSFEKDAINSIEDSNIALNSLLHHLNNDTLLIEDNTIKKIRLTS